MILLEARFLLLDGRYPEAEAALLPLTSRAHLLPQAAAALAWLAIARLGRGDVAGATDAAEQASALDPEDGVVQFALRSAGEARRPRGSGAIEPGLD